MQHYDVIIAGGGPTGTALAIELGMNNIQTLVLEKHAEPLLSPRAQSLNARSMEFFLRWHINQALKEKKLLPDDYPIQGVWCSTLNGTTYATSSSNDLLNNQLTPERAIRIPLWLTEEVLRTQLQQYSSVHFLKQHTVTDIKIHDDHVNVSAINHLNEIIHYTSSYVVACDGANSVTRQKSGIAFKQLAEPRRVISILFESPDLENKITVAKGFLYYILQSSHPGAIGIIDPKKGLWHAQIGYQGTSTDIADIDLHQLLFDLTGMTFTIKNTKAHFWNMHIQLADQFDQKQRVFLVGDSAHAFVPTGGFGLNTGLGDVINLAWKLAAVIKHHTNINLLNTYHAERKPICLHNLHLAQKNADDMMKLKSTYDPTIDTEKFAQQNAVLAKQFAHSAGTTMGYAYFNSALTHLLPDQDTTPMRHDVYHAYALPGYFLPYRSIDNQSIYQCLSATNWTWLVSSTSLSTSDQQALQPLISSSIHIEVMTLPSNTYPFKYILVRPDWHIAYVSNDIHPNEIQSFLSIFYA